MEQMSSPTFLAIKRCQWTTNQKVINLERSLSKKLVYISNSSYPVNNYTILPVAMPLLLPSLPPLPLLPRLPLLPPLPLLSPLTLLPPLPLSTPPLLLPPPPLGGVCPVVQWYHIFDLNSPPLNNGAINVGNQENDMKL